MRVAEYRDIYADLRQMGIDYHACVDVTERIHWESRARLRLKAETEAVCPRASDEDRSRMMSAVADLYALIRTVEAERLARQNVAAPDVALKGTVRSRAARYNQSPARAVRLRRAARSAMRRGYF